jgi:hypothetical protein
MPVGVDGFAAGSAGVAGRDAGWLVKTACVYPASAAGGTPATTTACQRRDEGPVAGAVTVNCEGIAASCLSMSTAGCREGRIKC